MSFKKVFKLGLVLSGLAAATVAQAKDCDKCDQYLQFIPQYSLASDIGLIGTTAIHSEGQAFNVDSERADKLIRSIKDDSRIPEECRSYVAGKIHINPRVSIVAEGNYGGKPPGFSMNYDYPAGMNNLYTGMVAANNPCTSQSGQAYLSCLQANGASSYAAFSQHIAGLSQSQLVSEIQSKYGVTINTNDAAVLQAYNAALNSGSSAGLMSWAKGAGKSLSTDQFLSVVQMVGYQMNTNYNFNRSGNVGTAGQGIVTVDQMLSGLKTSTMYLVSGWNDPAHSINDYEGVCRDAAVVQAQMLQSGGFKNSFTVTYRDTSGGHVDVITQDPNDRTKLYTINWFGRATHQNIDGSQALFQGSGSGIPDYSQNYVISAPDGRNVADVPSEMGKFLTEAAGGSIQNWDKLSRGDSSIVAVSVAPDPKGHVQVRALYGSDGNGASYVGGAADVHWGTGTNFPGQVGVFVGQQFRPAGVYGTWADGTTLLAYGQAEQHAITPKVKLGDHASAVLDTSVVAGGTLSLSTSGPDHDPNTTMNNFNINGDHRIQTEVRIDQTAMNGKLKAQYVAGASAMIGQSDVRSADISATTVVPLSAYAGARATLDVGAATLFGQSMFVFDQLGIRDRVEVGVSSRKIAASVYEAGRVTDGTALVQDNSLRRVGASVTYAPNKHMQFGVSGEIPIEGDDPLQGAKIYGTGILKF